MVQKIDATLQRADALVTAARDGATPRHVVDRIVAAGGDARAEDRRTIATAAAELKDATRALQGVTASARRGYEQNRWLMWTAIGGVVLGMVLWAAFAGVVARAVPASWQWPEKMAARALDLSMWEGGQRMMQAASPTAFRAIIAADRMVLANRETIEARPQPERARRCDAQSKLVLALRSSRIATASSYSLQLDFGMIAGSLFTDLPCWLREPARQAATIK
jgi:hypothetical protein